MKKCYSFRKIISLVLTMSFVLSLVTLPASALSVDLSDYADMQKSMALGQSYEVSDQISLAEDAAHEIAMTLTEAVGDPTAVTFTLTRNSKHPYVDVELYPNQKSGGAMASEWKTQKNTALFTDISAAVDGETLTLSFNSNCYFYSRNTVDYSAPHSSGGAYLDLCGYFTLTAKVGETAVAETEVKIVPYDNFHTMDELYVQQQQIAKELTKLGLYASYEVMGQSTAGRDMPYLVVADKEESVNDWLDMTNTAEVNPEKVLADIESGVYDDIRVPAMYSNVHANEVPAADGILEFGWMLVDALKNHNGKISYDKLTGFTEAGEAQLASEFASRGGKYPDGVAVPDLVKNTATYLGYLQTGNGKSGVVDLDTYYESETVEVDVADLLENVFFVLIPEENVDGRTYITRASSNGYDLNRDNSFQTTSETANMQRLIGQYNPVSLTEFHGRVTDFQCEPCDPPHEPNFEYDLLAEHLIPGGEALGIAAVANNKKYNSYVIPQRDYLVYTDNTKTTTYWSDPWDDMSTSYTPQFAMLQGTVAYTVELPAYDDNGTELVTYGILGQADYIAQEKLDYLTSQVEIFKRGVNNENSDAYELVGQWLCDQYDVEGAEMELFRPEFEENGNFYPEFYIIPMDSKLQSNLQAAADMMVWLTRNDAKVQVTTASFKYDGVTYPAGTMIVSMHQAKRSVANGALYDGTPIHSWTVLYSEGITSFADTRGFDMVTVASPAAYTSVCKVLSAQMDEIDAQLYTAALTSAFSGVTRKDVIISNASEDSTAAVNALLKAHKSVALITGGDYEGDFICSYNDYLTVAGKYLLTATGVDVSNVKIKAKLINGAPVVYITGVPNTSSSGFAYNSQVSSASNWNYDRVAMELMNFTVTENVSKADVVAGSSSLSGDALTAVQKGVPYIGYGSSATADKAVNKLFTGSARTSLSGAMDCKEYVTYPNETIVNASYIADGDEILYGYGYGYFSKLPEGAVALVQVDNTKEPTECFIPTDTDARQTGYAKYRDGGVLGYSYDNGTVHTVLFANSLTHKGHQRDEYAYISNFIFSSCLSETDYHGTVKEVNASVSGTEATVSISAADISGLKQNETLSLDVVGTDATVEEISVTLPNAQSAALTGKSAGLNVSTELGTLQIPSDTLQAILAQTGSEDLQIKVETVDTTALQGTLDNVDLTDAAAVEFTLKTGIGTISQFGSDGESLSVQIPVDEVCFSEGSSYVAYIISGSNTDKTSAKISNGTASVETTHFSTFVVTNKKVTTYSGGGSVITEKHVISLASASNGSVKSNVSTAAAGSKVTLTVSADTGYQLEKLSVTDKNSKAISLTAVTEGAKYTFTMPAGAVTVSAVFAAKSAAPASNPFTDVAEGKYYYDAVLWAVSKGITSGVDSTHFAPKSTITRAQMVTFLWRAAGSPEPTLSACGFTDIVAGKYYEKAVLWAVENGITTGATATTFAPNEIVTRAQSVTFLARFAGVDTTTGGAQTFSDVPAGKYYSGAVAWAVENGITTGATATTFAPKAECQRAQIITFMYRYFTK